MTYKVLISLFLAGALSFPATTAFAEEMPADNTQDTSASEPTTEAAPEPIADPEPAPAETAEIAPAPEPAYEPEPAPSVAPDEPAGYAVVDPDTGNVLNIIVCTKSVCGAGGSFGGKLYDPASGITGDLVYQTPPGSGGYRSAGNDYKVTYKKDTEVFQIESKSIVGGRQQTNTSTLDPKNGGRSTLTEIKSKITYDEAGTNTGYQSIEVETEADDLSDTTSKVTVLLPQLNEGSIFDYADELMAQQNLKSDVDAVLEEPIVLESPDYKEEEVKSTIQKLVDNVVNWLKSIFGGEDV